VSDGQYILPGELAALLAFWLLPPLLLTAVAQAVVLRRRAKGSWLKVVAGVLLTALLSAGGLFAFMVVEIPSWLRAAHEALLLPDPYGMLLFPMAFPIVGAVAVLVTFALAAIRGRPA
jgi:hypothetical protein